MEKTHYILGLILVAIVVIAAWWLHRSNVGEGKRLAEANCAGCHDLTPKMVNKTGPYLWGVVNRTAGSITEFNYSESFRRFAESRKLTWTEANLDQLITDPDRLIPGTKMADTEDGSQHNRAFRGIQNEEHRRALIAYLRTLK